MNTEERLKRIENLLWFIVGWISAGCGMLLVAVIWKVLNG